MATDNFHARLERIQKTQQHAPISKPSSFRTPGVAGIAAAGRVKRRRRRHPVMEHLMSVAFGIVSGGLIAVALIGLSLQGGPWGPGTPWHDIAFYPIMAGLALAPLLMCVSLLVASRRPGFALFSLGYLSGVVIPLFV
ncbi:hypothetical protein [Roseobacter weihaiensis]|uniref:hypothetical protein n=1 Tax=Roseobacter weihaiensis TaxID=2763262 RepID=UPI001D0A1DF8|nr:hypothetical protein [Roseobacter sp. H9]